MKRPEVPYLIAGVLLALAACALVALHDSLPQFLPLAVIALLSAGAGISLPGAAAAAAVTTPSAAAPDPLPAAVPSSAAAAAAVDTSARF